ncbi:MAG TPA: hypothetical protein VFI15_04790 [Candidatus Limnocylindrales bacterium]|nr:hypothetical protein [Candidatus Limnocylindrales bacterium]
MSRKHFADLARALRKQRPEPEGFADPDRRRDYEYDVWRAVVVEVADVCYSFNGRFDRGRFYRAAGLDA